MITAPFNFVPLSNKVFFPPWADEVSHDIPFEDGESGTIDITITAKSPIFIRDNVNPEQFCSYNKEYYIPSTSVKGMVRSVLEIMSFSKMSMIDDDTYAVRDLSSSKNFYMSQMSQLEEPLTHCGWLKKDGDGFLIEDCDIPARIRHEEIDKATGKTFAEEFKNVGFEKTSEYKYNILGKTHQEVTVGELYNSTTNAKYDKRLFCKYSNNGKEGTLVVTGQPTPRRDTGKMGDGKGFEFIFFDSKKEIKLTTKNMKDFLFAYFDKRTTEPKESPDWTYWKKKLENGGKVPVFFQKNGNEVAHFGLSYLYKLPYKHSVKDGLKEAHFDNRLDLAQTIFGYTNKDNALKGRVQFSHLKAVSNIKELKVRTEVLGTPRASYYPIYVKQQEEKLFTTFMDDFDIAGWKRYPIHRGSGVTKTEDTGNANVGTTFAPLKDGVVFRGKLRYHNLKKAELGALLSALTFHNTKECYHNIGMAKSLGYGKIDIKLDVVKNLDIYLKAFELNVTEYIPNWSKSSQLQELLTMATEQNNSKNSKLEYMSLEDFAQNKTGKKYCLRSYTTLNKIKVSNIRSLILKEDLEGLKQKQIKREEEETELQKKREEEKLLIKEKKLLLEEERKKIEQKELEFKKAINSKNPQIIQNFIDKYKDYEKIDEIIAKKDTLQKEQQNSKHQKVNDSFKSAYNALQKKKANQKQYKKELDKFIKKWTASKNNKGSEYILDEVKKIK